MGWRGEPGIALLLDVERRFGIWVGNESPAFWLEHGGPALPMGWSCIELMFVVDDTDGSIEIYRDGVSVRSVSCRMTVSPEGPYQGLEFGIVSAFDAPLTLYIDDIVVGPRRVPCP